MILADISDSKLALQRFVNFLIALLNIGNSWFAARFKSDYKTSIDLCYKPTPTNRAACTGDKFNEF